MLLPNIDPLPPGFVFAKWFSIVAVLMTPLMFIAAAIRQSAGILAFAAMCLVFIPFMALFGYWLSAFVYASFLHQQENRHLDLFPPSWPFPFSWFNTAHRQSRQFEAVFVPIFMNTFVVLWSGFLLLWVIAANVVGFFGHLWGQTF